MILATALAFGMAWKTKDLKIDSRFSDANTVFLAIASQLQAWFGKTSCCPRRYTIRWNVYSDFHEPLSFQWDFPF
jgi:hypothetical protein